MLMTTIPRDEAALFVMKYTASNTEVNEITKLMDIHMVTCMHTLANTETAGGTC